MQFFDTTMKVANFWLKMLMSAGLEECPVIYMFSGPFLGIRHNCTKFHHCKISVTNFRRGGGMFDPPSVSSPENFLPE